LVTGLEAWGLAEGGSEELVALAPRRACKSRTGASSSATALQSLTAWAFR
jgi:hypothetical protein